MAAKLFQDWQQELAAYWLRKGLGGTWLKSLGALKDEVEFKARSAVLQRFPDRAAPDAINRLGVERALERPYNGTDAAYGTKLKDAFNRWYWGGTFFGLLRELVDVTPGSLGFDYYLIVQTQQDAKWTYCILPMNDPTTTFQLASPPMPQLSLGSPERWNTFIVELHLFNNHTWHGAVPNDTSDFANTYRRVIQRWRPQHAECKRIIIQDQQTAGTGFKHLWGVPELPNVGNIPVWGLSTQMIWGYSPGTAATTYWTPPTQ